MDWLFHVNQGAYLGYAMECATRASLAGAYPHFSVNVSNWFLRTSTELHSIETFPGDRMTVWTWEDPEDACALYFVIKKDNELVYRCRLVFYTAAEGADI